MEIYLLIVIVLFVLAISDLVVGVSNDAVNFLNSAIGSMVANRQTIMIVASLGIILGATFSSGMMEVARKGVFFPTQFSFADVMIIFAAVMLTDIFLLDLFNTLGLPTSTTVSIVFELLGASVCIAILKLAQNQQGLDYLSEYINANNALLIISGIFLSIVFAFTIGAIVQFMSRLLFSFQYHKKVSYTASIWAGLALTAMIYFLFIKGLQGASFISEETLNWVNSNTYLLLGFSVAGITLFLQFLSQSMNLNVFRLVVLFGTFSLAMAFAGNDLVNFIGVPIAGLESFMAWKNSGMDPHIMNMGVLAEPVRANTLLLLLAGIIMIVTLWTSKKARSVTETEVNLGRQDEGFERFESNFFAQYLVRGTLNFFKNIQKGLPGKWRRVIASKYQSNQDVMRLADSTKKPAFDLIRASVNLAVASMLIAFATSLKLPLSTTYVSFMVAMGTSLSDRAWGRESAVYRISGVLHVVGGWLVTAIIAFVVSSILALLIFTVGLWMIPVILVLVAFFIYFTFRYHREQEKVKLEREAFEESLLEYRKEDIFSELASINIQMLGYIKDAFIYTLRALDEEDLSIFKKAKKQAKHFRKQNERFNSKLYKTLQSIHRDSKDSGAFFIKVYDYELELIKSIEYILEKSGIHLKNSHLPLKPKQQDQLRNLEKQFNQLIDTFTSGLKQNDRALVNQDFLALKKQIHRRIDEYLFAQIEGIQDKAYNTKNSQLYLNILLESKDLVAVIVRIAKLFHKYR